MHALNHTLERIVVDADGRYLEPGELSVLENYVNGYNARLQAYQQIGQHSKAIVLTALKKFAQLYPELIKASGRRCQFDMSEVLRTIAMAILTDDEEMFQEQMMFWLDTVLRAHHKQTVCSHAYKYLQETIDETLPAATASLTRPYIDIVLSSLKPYS